MYMKILVFIASVFLCAPALSHAQNVLVPSSSTTTKGASPSTQSSAPAASSATQLNSAQSVWDSLPSTTIPQADSISSSVVIDQQAMINQELPGLISLQQNVITGNTQIIRAYQQQIATDNQALAQNPSPQARSDLISEIRQLNQSIVQSQAEIQKAQSKIKVMQTTNLTADQLSTLMDQ